MPYVIGINPVKNKMRKKTGAPKSKGAKMAAKKRTAPKTKIRTRTKQIVKWRVRKQKKQAVAKKIRRNDATREISRVIRDGAAAAVGMVIAKMAVNKLTVGGSEQDLWSWPNIFMAGASSVIAGFALGALLKLKSPTIAMIGLGGVALGFYKMITTILAPRWEWSKSWLGADDDESLIAPEFQGSILDTVNYTPSVMGQLPGYMGATDSGGQTVPFDPRFGATESGGQLVPFDPRFGGSDDPMGARASQQRMARAYGY